MRQQQLQEQYHFTCACLACVQGPCSPADAALVGLRCVACPGPVVPGAACPANVCSLHPLPTQLPGARQCFKCATLQAACGTLLDRLQSTSSLGVTLSASTAQRALVSLQVLQYVGLCHIYQACRCRREMSEGEESARLATLKGSKEAYDRACSLLSEGDQQQEAVQLLQSSLQVSWC